MAAEVGISADNAKGLALAVTASVLIGASFIVKKKGLRKAAETSGIRAGQGSLSYLLEPLWWAGMCSMIVGEIANVAAYAFAPAILVTPLGGLSIIISAALAHVILQERLHSLGVLGCVLCIVGSTIIALHAPEERQIESVKEVWELATDPTFLSYAVCIVAAALILIFYIVPQHGQTHIMVYIAICSLLGSLTIMSVKAIGIAMKLTLLGMNQLFFPETWFFILVIATFVSIQIIYLNKALDTFNTAVVTQIYYVMFTSLTILASVIMFKDWDWQNPTQVITELCGFVTILSGTYLLQKSQDITEGLTLSLPQQQAKHASHNGYAIEVIPLKGETPIQDECFAIPITKHASHIGLSLQGNSYRYKPLTES